MKLSLIFPIKNELQHADSRFRDLKSFWQGFDAEIEFIFIIDPKSKKGDSQWQESLKIFADDPKFKIISEYQKKSSGRGPAIHRGLELASGDFMATMSFDFAIPQGEVIASLSELFEQQGPVLLIGNRRGSKNKWQRQPRKKRNQIEEIEFEKAKSLGLPDPTSPFVILNQAAKEKLLPIKLRRWFYTPQIAQKSLALKIPIFQREVQAIDSAESKISWLDLFL